jgi:hypothetical protein
MLFVTINLDLFQNDWQQHRMITEVEKDTMFSEYSLSLSDFPTEHGDFFPTLSCQKEMYREVGNQFVSIINDIELENFYLLGNYMGVQLQVADIARKLVLSEVIKENAEVNWLNAGSLIIEFSCTIVFLNELEKKNILIRGENGSAIHALRNDMSNDSIRRIRNAIAHQTVRQKDDVFYFLNRNPKETVELKTERVFRLSAICRNICQSILIACQTDPRAKAFLR